MARWILRASIVASVLLIVAHFAYTFSTFHAVTLESVQFAELGLPLLFAAFLNGVVWTAGTSRLARVATHLANAMMIVVAVLVARLAPLPPAYLVLACSIGLGVSGILAEWTDRAPSRSGSAAVAA